MKFTNAAFVMIVLWSTMKPIKSEPFSFTEIQQIPSFQPKRPAYVMAPDYCRLAYYAFVPKNPTAVVIFYHGAGLYGNAIHQWLAKELQDKYKIATYIVDIRGHGNSAGDRGDALTVQTVWNDVTVLINHVRATHAGLPLYLAGHSSGAGLILNYAAWPPRTKVDGLILLAPYLGPLSGCLKEHTDPEKKFAKKVRSWVYTVAGFTGGRVFAHIPAVYFNYPESVFRDNKILHYYTYVMSAATTPYETKSVFGSVEIPTGMFVASDDEQFIAPEIMKYAQSIPIGIYCYAEIVNAKHLSILLQAPELIKQMIEQFAAR